MRNSLWILGAVLTTSILTTTSYADNSSRVAAASALGGIVGANIGLQVGGTNGANIGAAIGGAGGAAAASSKANRKESAIGGGLGSIAGASVGANIYGSNGQIIGAGLGAAGGAILGNQIGNDRQAEKRQQQLQQARYSNRNQWKNGYQKKNYKYYR